MGKINISILTLLIFTFIFADTNYCQSIQIIDYNSLEKPLSFTKGKMLNIQCDTVFLISCSRYRLYEKARNSILFKDFNKYNEVIDAYENKILYYKQWNDSLRLNYTDLNTMFKNSLGNTQKTLTSINNNLTAAKDSLGIATKKLDDSMQHLKAAQREKWYFASIGFLLGSLVTILLVGK